MGVHLAEQTKIFLQSCLLGAALGMLYDVFRMLRLLFSCKSVVVFFEDLLYWILCAVVTFLFSLAGMDGVVRAFFILGELIGAVLYRVTISTIILRLAQQVIDAAKFLFRTAYRLLIRPCICFLSAIFSVLCKPWCCLGNEAKKIRQKVKFRLKVRCVILYNCYVNSAGINRTKIHGKKGNAWARKPERKSDRKKRTC